MRACKPFQRVSPLAGKIFNRFFTAVLIFNFVFPLHYAQALGSPQPVPGLPPVGQILTTSAAFEPTLIKGLTVHPDDPLLFDFIVTKGDEDLDAGGLNAQAKQMVKYFLATLTIPDQDLWVNLSPYEKDRIIPDAFGRTEMGRDLLSQDYLLKQLTASLMYPDGEIGQRLWKTFYQKAYEKYGTTKIPLKTFNKIWIVPASAAVYEKDNSVYLVDSKLKVMLDQDYTALNQTLGDAAVPGAGQDKGVVTDVQTDLIREILVPEIEKEVNEGETFAKLRQIYNAMILAVWYKQNLRESLLGEVYVNRNKIKGIDLADKDIKEKIYQQYLEAFRKGVYNYIKEDYDPATKQVIPRKYYSGGADMREIQPAETPASSPLVGETLAAIRADGKTFTVSMLEESAEDRFPAPADREDAYRALVASSPVPALGQIGTVEEFLTEARGWAKQDAFGWPQRFIKTYNQYRNDEDFLAKAKLVLARMLFDDQLRRGAAYLLHMDFLPGLVQEWGDDRSAFNVLAWYANGQPAGNQQAVDIAVNFYSGTLKTAEQKRWFLGELLSIVAFESERSVVYMRALHVLQRLNGLLPPSDKTFWRGIVSKSGINNGLRSLLGGPVDLTQKRLALKAQYDPEEGTARERFGPLWQTVLIDNIGGEVKEQGGGRYLVTVHADIYNHDNGILNAAVKWRQKGSSVWQTAPTSDQGDHRREVTFVIDGLPEGYEFSIEAWVDAGLSWEKVIVKRIKAAPDQFEDIHLDALAGEHLLTNMLLQGNVSDAKVQVRGESLREELITLNTEFRRLETDGQKRAYVEQVRQFMENRDLTAMLKQYPVKELVNHYEDYGPGILVTLERGVFERNELEWIGNIWPSVDSGAYAAKAIAGEPYDVQADIHVLAVEPGNVFLKYRLKGTASSRWQKTAMEQTEPDSLRWKASFIPETPGRYEISFEVQRGDDHFVFEQEAAPLEVMVNSQIARYSTWYEFFPRSFGSFKSQEIRRMLARVRDMGFNVLYLPPIHPIGRTKRKGANNSLEAQPGEPGSPWAIGDAAVLEQGVEGDGGHRSVDPNLGTLEDFRDFVQEAEGMGLTVALDLTLQVSPDHPWVAEHPQWFKHRPDGSIQFAENPPKKYEDVYPINFEPTEDSAREALWNEVRDVVEFWISQGVTIFRVDNPHKKPFLFWEWLIDDVHKTHPDVIFLAEAFTEPKIMRLLGKVGFQQSYTYFPWKNTKSELNEFVFDPNQGILPPGVRAYFRGNTYINTPDVLPQFLTGANPAMFKVRYLLAMMSPSLGIYGPQFELTMNRAHPGSTDYEDSEKYQLGNNPLTGEAGWQSIFEEPLSPELLSALGSAGEDISGLIARANRFRQEHPAMQTDDLQFLTISDREQDPMGSGSLFAYMKRTQDNSDVAIVAVNLDPAGKLHWGRLKIPVREMGITDDAEEYDLEDVLRAKTDPERVFTRSGSIISIGLDSSEKEKPLAHVWAFHRIKPGIVPQYRVEYRGLDWGVVFRALVDTKLAQRVEGHPEEVRLLDQQKSGEGVGAKLADLKGRLGEDQFAKLSPELDRAWNKKAAVSSAVTVQKIAGNTVGTVIPDVIRNGGFYNDKRLRRWAGNDAVEHVLADRAAEKIIFRNPENRAVVLSILKKIGSRISLSNPGEMHFKVFDVAALKQLGLAAYLATNNQGHKELLISGSPRYRKIFDGLDYEIAVITTEMGFGISGYGGVGTYMATLLPYLSEYKRVIEVGWDKGGVKLNGREASLGELMMKQGRLKDAALLPMLRMYGVKQGPMKGYDTVRQAYRMSKEMVDHLAVNHPGILAAYIQVWYNGAAVPFLDRSFPEAAKFAIFHSVQPSKHWKAGAFQGEGELRNPDGQMNANLFESNYVSPGMDGIIEMTHGNGEEVRQFYREGQVRINPDHYAWLAGEDATGLFEELVTRGYLQREPEGKGLLTKEFETVVSDYMSWYRQMAETLVPQGYMDEAGLKTDKAQKDNKGFLSALAEFENNHPRPQLTLAGQYMQYEEDAIKLVAYPRGENFEDKMRVIYHGIPGEVTDIPKADRAKSFTVYEEYLQKHAASNPGKMELLQAKLQEAREGTRKIITYIGRLSGQKGLSILINSLRYLDQHGEKYLLVLVSSDPDSDEMKALAEKDIPNNPNILWINEHVPEGRNKELMQTGSDVILVPSTNEPFGLVILEAWRAHIPVVALKGSGGPEELVRDIRTHPLSDSDGTLADAQTAEALADAIGRLLALSPEEMTELRQAVYHDFEDHYTLRSNTVPSTFSFFEEKIMEKQRAVFAKKKAEIGRQGGATYDVMSDAFSEVFGTFMQATLLAEGQDEVVIPATPEDETASNPVGAQRQSFAPITSYTAEGDNVGGINLNPELLDLQIKRDGNGVPLPLLQQPIETMNIQGFIPVIINVTPVTNLPLLLGDMGPGPDREATPEEERLSAISVADKPKTFWLPE